MPFEHLVPIYTLNFKTNANGQPCKAIIRGTRWQYLVLRSSMHRSRWTSPAAHSTSSPVSNTLVSTHGSA